MTREEAIKVLLQHSEHWKRLLTENICSKEEGAQTVEVFNMAIKALEQEPKTGHWTYIGNSRVNGLKICECSNCNKRTYGSHNYCPNCGAKMVEPQEREKINCKSTKCENCINRNYCDFEPQKSEE